MTTLDRPLYRQGTQVLVDVVQGSYRSTIDCHYLNPVGRGGLHYVAETSSGARYSVPLENIGRK